MGKRKDRNLYSGIIYQRKTMKTPLNNTWKIPRQYLTIHENVVYYHKLNANQNPTS